MKLAKVQVVKALSAAILMLPGCADGAPSSIYTSGSDLSDDEVDSTGAEDGDTSDAGADTDTGSSTDDGDVETDTSDTSTDDTSTDDTSTGDTTTGDGDGDPGPACSSVDSDTYPGSGGSATANQNCPVTEFQLAVADAPGPVVDIEVAVDGIAANTAQNRLWLIGPSNIEVLLFDRRGNAFTDDWVGTYFDDESPTSVASSPGPFHGCFRPEQALANFDGQAANGNWRLRVETCLYETSITSWSVHIDY